MKTVFATFALLVAAVNAVAVPETFKKTAEGGLEVKSDFFPGVIFTGTAKSIYTEMKSLKPESVGNATAEELEGRGLQKRASYNCGWGGEIPTWNNCVEGVGYLQALGTAQCGVNGGYGTRSRVSCSWSCGIYLSNKLNSHLWVHCGDIAGDVNSIVMNCNSGPNSIGLRIHGAKDFDSHFIGLGHDNC